MKRGVTERGKGEAHVDCIGRTKEKGTTRRIIPVSPSGTNRFLFYFFYFAVSFIVGLLLLFVVREKTQKYSRNRVEMLKWPTESVGTSSSLAGECRQRAPFAFLAPKIQKQQKVGNT